MRVIVGWGPDAGRRLLMLQISSLLPFFPLFLLTAVITHLVISFGQTLMHYKLGHHRMGGRFFHNHINFHHTYYSKDHLVSRTYLGDEGNNTPFFFIPVFLAGGCAYFILPLNLFVVMVVASAASFYAHVFFRQRISCRGITTSAICVVQAEAGIAFRSSPARELQFCCDSLLLG
jgi:hypothetical protein